MKDSVLMESNWLNIMLMIESVVERVVSFVITMDLDVLMLLINWRQLMDWLVVRIP